METKTLTSSAIWYHISSTKGDSASRWAKGAARKGVYNGKSGLSLILFDRKAIADAIGDSFLQKAELEISRDAAYGTDAATVCVAPAYITNMSEMYMSRSECIGMAKRNMHKCYVAEGSTATFSVPGATLREIWRGEVNAFLLYQERDGSDSYCRFGDSAVLKMEVGSDRVVPVWTREISAGDTICNDIYSHYADLREIEYYINLRNQYHSQASSLNEISSLQAYGEWTTYIQALRTKAEIFLEQEMRVYDWTPLPAGMDAWPQPQANVINNLRGIFRSADADRFESDGFMTRQTSTSASGKYREYENTDWTQPNTLLTGITKLSSVIGHQPAIYEHYVCGWIFDWGNTVIDNAVLEITVRTSEVTKPHISLIGITADEVPENAAYNAVFGSAVIGEGDIRSSATCQIQINSRGIELMTNGTIHGMGIRYENEKYEGTKIELSKTATLIINENESE